MSIALDRATAQSLSALQVTLPGSVDADKLDCTSLVGDCLDLQVPAGHVISLTGADGRQHPAQVFPLAQDPNGQAFNVTGIPPGKSMVVVVEGLTRDSPPKLGASGCAVAASIGAGQNAPLQMVLYRKDPPLDCDPRYEK